MSESGRDEEIRRDFEGEVLDLNEDDDTELDWHRSLYKTKNDRDIFIEYDEVDPEVLQTRDFIQR